MVIIDGALRELPRGDTLEGLFLPTPDNSDDTLDDGYFYFGWESVEGGWLVRRQDRADSLSESATEDNNSSYDSYTDAWSDRDLLDYE